MEIDNEIIADLIGGLMVPCSMGMLGTAKEPYDKLVDIVMGKRGLLGWPKREEILKRMQQTLKGE